MKAGKYHHIIDQELLERFQSDGNTAWLGILLERYTLLLLGVCMKYLKNEEEAKDSVQQIFLKVLTDISKYKVEYFKSWLYMVAKNYCLMRLRGQQGKALAELTDKIFIADQSTASTEQLEDEKTYSLLEEAIEELNAEQRECVILFYLHKNSYQQISSKTGYSPMQVKSYIQNGKRNLKLMMEKEMQQQRQS